MNVKMILKMNVKITEYSMRYGAIGWQISISVNVIIIQFCSGSHYFRDINISNFVPLIHQNGLDLNLWHLKSRSSPWTITLPNMLLDGSFMSYKMAKTMADLSRTIFFYEWGIYKYTDTRISMIAICENATRCNLLNNWRVDVFICRLWRFTSTLSYIWHWIVLATMRTLS